MQGSANFDRLSYLQTRTLNILSHSLSLSLSLSLLSLYIYIYIYSKCMLTYSINIYGL
jgi:hypothetical protein